MHFSFPVIRTFGDTAYLSLQPDPIHLLFLKTSGLLDSHALLAGRYGMARKAAPQPNQKPSVPLLRRPLGGESRSTVSPLVAGHSQIRGIPIRRGR